MVSRIISTAMVVGPTFFLLFIIVIHSKGQKSDISLNAISDVNAFIYVLIALGLCVYASFLILPKFFLSHQNLKKWMSKDFRDPQGNNIDDPVMKLIMFDRMFMIIRLAMLEGISLFAIVILFFQS